MKCEKCGKEISDNSVFCNNCGSKLVMRQKKFCGNCGIELHSNAEFCGNCGFPTKSDNSIVGKIHSNNDTPLKKKRSASIIIVALLLIIALIATNLIGYVIYERYKNDEEEQLFEGNYVGQNTLSEENLNSVIQSKGNKHEENKAKDKVGSIVRTDVKDVENKVLTIRSWYNNTQSKLETLSTVEVAEGRKEYYDNAKRVRVDLQADDKNTYTRFYYFKDDKLYFVFAFDGTKENRLYFDNEVLFRWIDENGKIHDNDFANNKFISWENKILNELALLR